MKMLDKGEGADIIYSQSFNDWQIIFTHEFGHAVGLDDLYVYSQVVYKFKNKYNCRPPCRLRHHQKDENAPQLALTLALSRRERVIAGKGAVGANLRVRPVALPQGEANLMGEVSAMPALVPCRGGFETRPSRG